MVLPTGSFWYFDFSDYTIFIKTKCLVDGLDLGLNILEDIIEK